MMSRRKDRARRGAAAVEMAVLLPFFCLAALGAVDFARVFRCAAVVSDCASNGAAAGVSTAPNVDPAALGSVIRSAAADAAVDLDAPPSISFTQGTDAEGFGYIEVTASYAYDGIGGGLWRFGSASIVRKARMMRTPAS